MNARLLALGAALLLLAPAAGAADREERERECREVKDKIEKIHKRRRAGYDAKTGNRLKRRLRELERKQSKVCR